MAMTPAIDLDLKLPFSPEPDFPPPVLTAERYLEWIESILGSMKKDGTLERLIANRTRPAEEMFVLP